MDGYIANPANTIVDYESYRLDRFRDICRRYEISDLFASKLRLLEGFEIIIVCDDSGSMQTKSDSKILQNPYGKIPTRWDELKYSIGVIIEISSILNDKFTGVNVFFLNRSPVYNVMDISQLDPVFEIPPDGYTPIAPVLQNIFDHKVDSKRLVILATDGAPTDINGNSDINGFKHVLQISKGVNDYLNIIACTDDDNVLAYLDNWDNEIPRLDVADDYNNERDQIMRIQGRNFPFSFGDYIVKCMLGSVDDWFDKLDEIPISRYNNKYNNIPRQTYNDGCKCIIF